MSKRKAVSRERVKSREMNRRSERQRVQEGGEKERHDTKTRK